MTGAGRQYRSGDWHELAIALDRAFRAHRPRQWHCVGFASATAALRQASWKVRPAPAWLRRRTVELLLPADRADAAVQVPHAIDSVIVDYDDTFAPSPANLQKAAAAVQRLAAAAPAVPLGIRPRPRWLSEPRPPNGSEPLCAAAVDLAHALALLRGHAQLFVSIPKLTGREEAAAWDQVLRIAEARLGWEEGTLRVNIQIESVSAVFEIEEIVWELRTRAVSLTVGRWDYLASIARTLVGSTAQTLPPFETLSAGDGFLAAYLDHLVDVAERRGLRAVGGVVSDGSPAYREGLLRARRAEAERGYRGAWVTDPGVAPAVRTLFGASPGRRWLVASEEERLAALWDLPPLAEIPVAAVRQSLNRLSAFARGWRRGLGSVMVDGETEDLSTAEARRSQLHLWLAQRALLDDGRRLDERTLRDIAADCLPAEGQAIVERLVQVRPELPLPEVLPPGEEGGDLDR